jgi:enamine deaminase RidA (YjgF/YER057c/UK114 family)
LIISPDVYIAATVIPRCPMRGNHIVTQYVLYGVVQAIASLSNTSTRASACLHDSLNTLPTQERYDLKMSKPLLSRVRRAGSVLYLSGIIGRGDTKESKFRDTFERIKGVLEENDLSLEDVVKAVVYLEDINDRPKYLNPLWREYFPDNPPTRTCVEAGLNGGQIEITAVAAMPD